MFGLGYLEICLLLLLLVVLFGGRRTGQFLGKAFGLYRKVEDTRHSMRSQFSLGNLMKVAKKEGVKKDK